MEEDEVSAPALKANGQTNGFSNGQAKAPTVEKISEGVQS
jgi:hypothetical protein